ncbi:hypothetical protein ABIB77_007640 [Bradyrhizobium sp. i1.14.1]
MVRALDAYVTQVLMPTLRPGDIVVMDNLAVHKRAEVALAIDSAGRPAPLSAALFARSQSDLNGLRQAQSCPSKGRPRSIEALLNAVAVALAAFIAQQCLNFFAAAGYDRV